jgi:Thiol:disulfide interchange protein
MTEWWLALGGVMLMGLMESMRPCPITTNLAAISYISRRVNNPREVLFSGVLYGAGRTLTYFILSFCVLSLSIFSGDQLTRYFSAVAGIFLGPVIILIGMTLTGLLSFSLPRMSGEFSQGIVQRMAIWSAFPLGMIFALAFCPTTAAMFLGMLTLAAKAESRFLFPLLYGICSALPIVVLAGLIAYQVRFLSKVLNALQSADVWMKNIVGILFIVLGVYLTIRYNFS